MPTKLDLIEIKGHPEGVVVSIRAVVPLPLGPVPTPEEFREASQSARNQLIQAIPGLIPALFHELAELESEGRLRLRLPESKSERSLSDQPSNPPALVGTV
jgi:hypothetical protein